MDYQLISKAVIANVFGLSRAAITKTSKGMTAVEAAKIRILNYLLDQEDKKKGKLELEKMFKKEYKKRAKPQERKRGKPQEVYNIKDALAMIDEVYEAIQRNTIK